MATSPMYEKTKKKLKSYNQRKLKRVAKDILDNLDAMHADNPNAFGEYFGAKIHSDLIEALKKEGLI
jgi:hypothetical protein